MAVIVNQSWLGVMTAASLSVNAIGHGLAEMQVLLAQQHRQALGLQGADRLRHLFDDDRRQPLGRLWLALPGGRLGGVADESFRDELLALMADELNVKAVVFSDRKSTRLNSSHT